MSVNSESFIETEQTLGGQFNGAENMQQVNAAFVRETPAAHLSVSAERSNVDQVLASTQPEVVVSKESDEHGIRIVIQIGNNLRHARSHKAPSPN